MKTKLFLTSLMLLSFATFISCGSNNETEPEDPTVYYPVEFVTFVLNDQSKYIDQDYVINVNGKAVSFNLSDMKAADASNYTDLKKKADFLLADSIKKDPSKEYYKVYKYTLGLITNSQSAYGEKYTFTVKNDRPGTETVGLLFMYGIRFTNTKIFPGYEYSDVGEISSKVPNDFENLTGFLKLKAEYLKDSPSLEIHKK